MNLKFSPHLIKANLEKFQFTPFFFQVFLLINLIFSFSCFVIAEEKVPLEKNKIIRILSDRTAGHLKPLFEIFEKKSGVKIQSLFVDKGLIPRLESNPEEADIVITKDADLLEIAKKKNLLQPFSSKNLVSLLPAEFRDKDFYYFSDSYRARVIFYSKERVKASELSSYKDLALAKWKNRICIRSGYDDYNINLFAQWFLLYGEEPAKQLILGLHNNLAKVPTGNDREQIRNIYEKKCDLAVANSYYMGIMLNNKEQKDWGLSAKVFFPDQKEKGSLILKSGLALTKSEKNMESSLKFLEFMISEEAQQYTVNATFAYPTLSSKNLILPIENKALGNEQSEIKSGVFKLNHISVIEIANLREKILTYLNSINFDSLEKK